MDNCPATLIIKNFKSYTPPKDHWLVDSGGAFLISEDNQDWYECQARFSNDTYKLQVSPDNRLVALSKDVSALFPYNCSVVEVESLPDLVQMKGNYITGDYVYDIDSQTIGERIPTEEEMKSKVDQQVNSLMKAAMLKLNPLQYAVDLKIATDEEGTLLNEYKSYVVELSRVKSQKGYPSEVKWPDNPEKG